MIRIQYGIAVFICAVFILGTGCDSKKNPVTPALAPIVVTSPTGSHTYHIGDTLHIAWEENSKFLTAIVIFLSIDGGISELNDASLTGTHQLALGIKKFDYVLTASFFHPGDLPSSSCVIIVEDYNDASLYGQSTGLFTIDTLP